VLKDLETELESLVNLNSEYLFEYLLDMGKAVPELPAQLQVYRNEVQGCQSRVWIIGEQNGNNWNFVADSDSYLVKGITKLVCMAVNGSNTQEVLQIKFENFKQISSFLTSQRQKGLQAVINAVHTIVKKSLDNN
jgi:cysteine desulfuration protein SufE